MTSTYCCAAFSAAFGDLSLRSGKRLCALGLRLGVFRVECLLFLFILLDLLDLSDFVRFRFLSVLLVFCFFVEELLLFTLGRL